MRQVVLDTETTGLAASAGQRILTQGHRIIEIGCVELRNRRPTGRQFHQYLNPERDIDAGASAVHGLSRERLASAPRFAEIAAALLEFIRDSELIIHNAEFDLAFLDMELSLLRAASQGAILQGAAMQVAAMQGAATEGAASQGAGPQAGWPTGIRDLCRVLDTLTMARERHPGQRNNLDALCKRYGIDSTHRELHGALLDAQLLADVYLAMTGGQSLLALEHGARERDGELAGLAAEALSFASVRPPEPLRVIEACAAELAAHAELIALLHKASGGRCLWLAAPTAD